MSAPELGTMFTAEPEIYWSLSDLVTLLPSHRSSAASLAPLVVGAAFAVCLGNEGSHLPADSLRIYMQ